VWSSKNFPQDGLKLLGSLFFAGFMLEIPLKLWTKRKSEFLHNTASYNCSLSYGYLRSTNSCTIARDPDAAHAAESPIVVGGAQLTRIGVDFVITPE